MLSVKLSVTAVMQLLLGWFLGLMLIPIFRRFKTGKYQPYIGDRFRLDGSEPAFGGVNALIVYAFGCGIAAAFVGNAGKLIGAAAFAAAVTAAGIFDDYLLDIRGQNAALKTTAKLAYTYAACLTFVLIAKRAGLCGSAVILPFGWGMFDFGAAWCPVCAVFMTGVIYSFRIMNRFGTDEDTCAGGLVYAVGTAAALGVSAVGTAARSDELTALGMVTAAALMTGLIWGLSPSKQRSGSSGGFFAGAVTAAGLTLVDFFQLAVLITALAAIIDSVCGLAHFLHYRRTKKLWLKGSTLHHHLKNRGKSDYTVIIIFTLITMVADGLGLWLTVYGYNKYF